MRVGWRAQGAPQPLYAVSKHKRRGGAESQKTVADMPVAVGVQGSGRCSYRGAWACACVRMCRHAPTCARAHVCVRVGQHGRRVQQRSKIVPTYSAAPIATSRQLKGGGTLAGVHGTLVRRGMCAGRASYACAAAHEKVRRCKRSQNVPKHTIRVSAPDHVPQSRFNDKVQHQHRLQ